VVDRLLEQLRDLQGGDVEALLKQLAGVREQIARAKATVGRGADTDIIVASAKALMNAINRLLAVQRPADTDVRTSP